MKTKRKSAEMRKKENKTAQQQCRSRNQQSQSTIKASHHQGSVIYKGAGMQCTPMAYTAVLYSTLSSPASWNTNVLDAILPTRRHCLYVIPSCVLQIPVHRASHGY